MARVRKSVVWRLAVQGLVAVLLMGAGHSALAAAQQSQPAPAGQAKPEGTPTFTGAQLVELVAPIALYPDQLLFQILMCSTSPFQVRELNEWLKKNPDLKGTALQEAAQKQGFDPSFVALSTFPQVVSMMAEKSDWTRQLGQAFTSDRKAVFDYIQRLRTQAAEAGNLKSTPQQQVQTQTTEGGQQVIVIQPANPQVIYVPQYNPQVVYTQPAPTIVVVHEDHSNEAAAAAVGFTVGVIVGAAANPYYWGPYPYGMYGGAGYWYASAWDDYYDHREDMFEDWSDHRQDMAGERTERQGTRQENRTERQGGRQENQGERQTGREENRTDRQTGRDQNQTDRQTGRQEGTATRQEGRGNVGGTDRTASRASTSESRGYGQSGSQMSRERSGTGSGAFSGYERGSSTRSASSRGSSSMSSSRGSRSGGRSGGGRRR